MNRWWMWGDSERKFLGLFLVPMWDPGGAYSGQPHSHPRAHVGVGDYEGKGTQLMKREPNLDGLAKSSNAICSLYRWKREIERGQEVPSKSYGKSVPHQGG